MNEIAIVDYGVGNLASVANMIRKVGGSPRLIDQPEQIASAGKLLLPGVGAWDVAMTAIETHAFAEPIREHAKSGRPLLGICLGMQLLFEGSEEGTVPGLGLLKGQIGRFRSAGLRVPHMGWNAVVPIRPTALFPEKVGEQRFYFAHSYHASAEGADVAATATYGEEFGCAFARDNVFGTQFHPEKSHRFGMALFERYLGLR